MDSGTMRLLALSCGAVLLAGCQDPLEPDLDRALLESQGSSRTTNDPQATATSAKSIIIFWSDNSSNESGWEIHRSTTGRDGTYSLLASTEPNYTGHNDERLEPNTEYCYRVRSFRVNGKWTSFAAFSNPACATTLAPPPAPSNTKATPPYSSAVEVTWTDNSQNESGFSVERSASSAGPWVVATITSPNTTSYSDLGRASEEEVCYRVFTLGSGTTSGPSNADCTTPPSPATSLKAQSADDGYIELTWTDNSAAEDGYEVRRWNGTEWAIVADLPADAISYREVLPAEAIPYYAVLAQKDGGHSDFSNVATIPPKAPQDVQAIPASTTTVWVYWSNMSANAEGFRIERSKDAGLTWEAVFSGGPEEGLAWGFAEESERQVCYRVFAFNSEGDSDPSAMDCTVPPAAPTNLKTITVDDQTVEHRWTDNSGFEDGYELWLYGFDGWDYYYYPVHLEANSTSYRGSSSEAVYGILALKDGGYSDWAFPVEVTAAALQSRPRTVSQPPARAQRTAPALKSNSTRIRGMNVPHLPSKGAPNR